MQVLNPEKFNVPTYRTKSNKKIEYLQSIGYMPISIKDGYAYYIVTNELIYELKQRKNGGGKS